MLSRAGPELNSAVCVCLRNSQACDRSNNSHAQYTNHCFGQVQINVAGLFIKSSDSPSFTYDVVVQEDEHVSTFVSVLAFSSPVVSPSHRFEHVQAKRQTRLVLVIRFPKIPRGYIPAWYEGP